MCIVIFLIEIKIIQHKEAQEIVVFFYDFVIPNCQKACGT